MIITGTFCWLFHNQVVPLELLHFWSDRSQVQPNCASTMSGPVWSSFDICISGVLFGGKKQCLGTNDRNFLHNTRRQRGEFRLIPIKSKESEIDPVTIPDHRAFVSCDTPGRIWHCTGSCTGHRWTPWRCRGSGSCGWKGQPCGWNSCRIRHTRRAWKKVDQRFFSTAFPSYPRCLYYIHPTHVIRKLVFWYVENRYKR